ncbi:hypothetical protein ACFWQD_03370 [Alcaligenes faecalis]|uniref:hypothetical protein n=1 Tax=Alcaligenes faecalis TaxID=511 RepID=UPI00364C0AA7
MRDWFGLNDPLSPGQLASLFVGLGAGGATGWLVATFPGWVGAWDTAYWWDIAAAIGTVGAVIVALGLAGLDYFRRRQGRKIRASLYAISIASKLQKYIDQLSGPAVFMIMNSKNDHMKTYEKLQQAVYKLDDGIPITDLLPLHDLDGKVASRIAHGFAQIDIVRKEMEKTERLAAHYNQYPPISKKSAIDLAVQLHLALDYLKAAKKTCQNSQGNYVVHPSGEDVHGR